jgi:hypothetical protein
MIFVECYSDTAIVKTLTNLSTKEVIHNIVGKSGVCNQLIKSRNSKGLIDEDPKSPKHPYERIGKLRGDSVDFDIRRLYYPESHNELIILCPKLENWLLKSAAISDIDVKLHGLPDNPDELHKLIDQKLSELRIVLHLLVKQKSERILALKSLLT